LTKTSVGYARRDRIAALLLAMIPLWLKVTPLAKPVVPEVKTMDAGSFSAISTVRGVPPADVPKDEKGSEVRLIFMGIDSPCEESEFAKSCFLEE